MIAIVSAQAKPLIEVGGLWGFLQTSCLLQKQDMFVCCYIRYPFSEGTVPLGQIWAGYPHTGHRVLVGVGRINMAVPKPHAALLLCWVQEICPSADVHWESSLRVGLWSNTRQPARWRRKGRGWKGRFSLLSPTIANHPQRCRSAICLESSPARNASESSITQKIPPFGFAARKTVVRHSKLALLPRPMLTFAKVHAVISVVHLLLNPTFCFLLCPACLPGAEMALTAKAVPTWGLCVDAELIHVSLFTQHLLWDFNRILAH